MTIKKAIGKIHLWLGLISGLMVFIIALTGCIYAFQHEIQELIQPYRFVEAQESPFLPPSEIRKIADEQLPGKHIHAVMYEGKERAARAIYFSFEEHYYDFVYVDQYSGEVLKVKDEYADFFRIVLDGHFYLWLPPEIGQPVVASATLVFVVMLISGIILWWPRNKKGKKKSFKIKWSARWRRKNYDLHNILGFYASFLALILALTGLIWGFEWFKNSVYAAAGGENSLVYSEPLSDTTALPINHLTPVEDKIWEKMKADYPDAASVEVHFPVDEKASVLAAVNPDASTYYQIDYIYFDQNTLKEVPATSIWGRYDQASAADKLIMMNYDLHTGGILGLPGKFLAFFVSLIVATLPVTGFMIWLGRRNKEKKCKASAENYRQDKRNSLRPANARQIPKSRKPLAKAKM